MRRGKGQSLLVWIVTFSVVMAGSFYLFAILKGNLRHKAIVTADYAFWRSWGNDPEEDLYYENFRAKTTSKQQQEAYLKESKGKIISSGLKGSQEETTVSSEVEEGSETLLDSFDLN